jgi:hypothetical protein
MLNFVKPTLIRFDHFDPLHFLFTRPLDRSLRSQSIKAIQVDDVLIDLPRFKMADFEHFCRMFRQIFLRNGRELFAILYYHGSNGCMYIGSAETRIK